MKNFYKSLNQRIEEDGTGIEKDGSGIEKDGSGIKRLIIVLITTAIFSTSAIADLDFNQNNLLISVHGDTVSISVHTAEQILVGKASLESNGALVPVYSTQQTSNDWATNVTGNGTGTEVTGNGTGTEVTGNGTGTEVTGNGTGTEVTGNGTGTEVTGNGTGTEVTGNGTGTEVTGNGTGSESSAFASLPQLVVEISFSCSGSTQAMVYDRASGYQEFAYLSNIHTVGQSSACAPHAPDILLELNH